MLVDSHCHFDFPVFDADREQLVQQAQNAGIGHIIVPSVGPDNWQQVLDLSSAYPLCHAALGCHPCFAVESVPAALEALETMLQTHRPNIIAIGEIGLDYATQPCDKAQQMALFEGQLRLAKRFDLPVIVHVRKAIDDCLHTLKRLQITRGIAHAFTGSNEQARQWVRHGFLLGIGGSLTYPNAQRLRALYASLPLTHIVLETDAPDMPLYGFQGQPNSPLQIPTVAHMLAELRGLSVDDIAAQTTANCLRCFDLRTETTLQ